MKVLVVEDDLNVARTLERGLCAHGHEVECADSVVEALQKFELAGWDAVFLDLGLPDQNGMNFLRSVRANGSHLPIMVISGSDLLEDKVKALRAGADDYIIKPFRLDELLARLSVVAKRSTPPPPADRVCVEELVLDFRTGLFSIRGETIRFPNKERALLELLIRRRGRVVSKMAILDELYQGRDEPQRKIIDVFISNIRRRLRNRGYDAERITTVWGQGYAFKP